MQPSPIAVLPSPTRTRPRTALVASSDRSFRQRLAHILTGLRWQVREAEGGAQAWAEAESSPFEAMIVDAWLPDLDVNEFLKDFRGSYPQVDLVTANGGTQQEGPRGPYRQELLYAIVAKNIPGIEADAAQGSRAGNTGSSPGLSAVSTSVRSLNPSNSSPAATLPAPPSSASASPSISSSPSSWTSPSALTSAAAHASSFNSGPTTGLSLGLNANEVSAPPISTASPIPAAQTDDGADSAAFDALSNSLPGSLSGEWAAARPGTAVGKPAQAEAATHAVHASESPEAVSAAVQAVSVQPVSALTETSAFTHSGNAHAQLASSLPASTPVPPAAPSTFAALDAQSGPGAASWTRTGAHSVEAGYNDPSLGWVGVRADLSAAGVHAAVVPGSAEAAQALAGQMPGLHTYLNEQRVGLGSLTLASPEDNGTGAGLSHELNQGMENAGQDPQQNRAPDAQAVPAAHSAAAALIGTGSTDAPAPLPGPLFNGAGAYISVMA